MTALDRRMCKNKRLCGYIPPLCCRSSTAIAYCYWLFFGVAAHWVLARTRGEEKDAPVASQPQRAGGFEGVKNGRISLARFNEMIISSVHVELAGSEEAFRRLLDHEWDQISEQPADMRSSFLACSATGRQNARLLRELAGSPYLVETLNHSKGKHLCSVVSLDRDSAIRVAMEGGGETFSLEPMPHLAKLSPAVAVDPSSAALRLSREGAAFSSETGKSSGIWIEGGSGGGRRNLLADRAGENSAVETLLMEQRAQLFAGVGAPERPTTRRLFEEGARGGVDAIEVTLALDPGRFKGDTGQLVEKWLTLAGDQASLSKILREKHFWGQHHQPEGYEDQEIFDIPHDQGRERGKGRSSADHAAIVVNGREQELAAHEQRKRWGWAKLLDDVDLRKRTGGAGVGGESRGRSLVSCEFDKVAFTVAPGGKKVLLHNAHKIIASASTFNSSNLGDRRDIEDSGCLSALLAFLSLQPEVHYITSRKKSTTMNLDAAWVTQSGVDGFTPLWDKNLQGQGEIIGVADTGLDMYHCQFSEDHGMPVKASDWNNPITDTTKRKVVQYIKYADDLDGARGHGTHVAGTIAGAESGEKAGDNEADGLSFQGKLAIFDFGDSSNDNALSMPGQIDEVILQPAYDAGARIHSNSWDTVSVEYTSTSKEVDTFVYTHPDFLVVFAAGNCGDTFTHADPVENCEHLNDKKGTVLSPAQAKNVIAVGASESAGVATRDYNTVSYFSSKGPTIDGRIKPDVVAPGDPTWSAKADPSGETCEYGSQTGTSMSTPVVAGNAAMARQYFREGWYNTGSKNLTLGFNPSAALLKAALINSATAMSYVGVNPEASVRDVTLTTPPDNHQGHGRVTMSNALNIGGTVGIFFEDWVEISEGETLEYEVSLHEEANLDKDLRITLVWTDPAASIGSTLALIHDLDLIVIAQSTGTVYYPNGRNSADRVNNVEKVTITDTTELETYTIQVSCDDLSDTDSQNFAVIANGEFIKTNALPRTPDPTDWLDFIDQAVASIHMLEIGVVVLGIVACCILFCFYRRCQRSRRHKVNRNRNCRRNRGAANRGNLRPRHAVRPQSYTSPRRPTRKPIEVGSKEFLEAYRRPEPVPSGRRGGRGPKVGGGAAILPAELHSESTVPPSPKQEKCPECGLHLPDVIQLVNHVEMRHGGRVSRKKTTSPAAGPAGAADGHSEMKTEIEDNFSPTVIHEKISRNFLSPPSAEKQTITKEELHFLSSPLSMLSSRHGNTFPIRQSTAMVVAVAVPLGVAVNNLKPCSGESHNRTSDLHPPSPTTSSSGSFGSPESSALKPCSNPSGSGLQHSTREKIERPLPHMRPDTRSRHPLSREDSLQESCDTGGSSHEHNHGSNLHENSRGTGELDLARNLARSKSVDCLTFSYRASTRSSERTDNNFRGSEGGGVTFKYATPKGDLQRFKRTRSAEEVTFPAHRLTAKNVKVLGLGPSSGSMLKLPMFGPVKTAEEGPVYSAVARTRAEKIVNA